MFVINTKKDTFVIDKKAKKPSEAEANVFHIAAQDDLKALATGELLEIFNSIARGQPDLKAVETSRFSTREVGERRVWGLFVQLKALAAGDTEEEPEEDPKPKAHAAPPAAKKPKATKAKAPKEPKVTIVKKASKTHELRKGSSQARALELISRQHGITIDDWIAEMNKIRKKGKWHRGNAWSGLVYLLNRLHGYGLRRENDRFYLVE